MATALVVSDPNHSTAAAALSVDMYCARRMFRPVAPTDTIYGCLIESDLQQGMIGALPTVLFGIYVNQPDHFQITSNPQPN